MILASIFELKDEHLLQERCYVDGLWREAKTRETFAIDDPATQNIIAKCPEFTAEDTTAAIESAKTAFDTFRHTPARERARLLRRWYDLMLTHVEDLARIITLENGKPLADARKEVFYAASFLEWFSEEAPRMYGDTMEASDANRRLITLKEPVGVCALIVPWNFPAAMITRKAGPALAAGCTTVIKAPAETPLTALAMAELAHRAGFPAGVVNVITASANTVAVGEVLTSHSMVKKVSFTGSTAVGKLLMKQSSSTLKKLSFELGGNAPFIVFEDADLDAAVDGVVASKFRISGQTCVCANRILVHERVLESFTARLLSAAKTFKVGNGLDPSTTHGPLIHPRASQKVLEHVDDAISKGARLLYGGQRMTLGPAFFEITILDNMKSNMRICHEETFGPVAAIFSFSSEQEAIELANSSEVGLAGYFYSRDTSRCWRVASALEVGMVGVNVGAISDAVAPFGGVKQSGFGREGSKYGIDDFVITKMVMMGIDQKSVV